MSHCHPGGPSCICKGLTASLHPAASSSEDASPGAALPVNSAGGLQHAHLSSDAQAVSAQQQQKHVATEAHLHWAQVLKGLAMQVDHEVCRSILWAQALVLVIGTLPAVKGPHAHGAACSPVGPSYLHVPPEAAQLTTAGLLGCFAAANMSTRAPVLSNHT